MGCRAWQRNGLTVTSDGNIFPCSNFVGLESFTCSDFVLGNIYEGIKIEAREHYQMKTKDFCSVLYHAMKNKFMCGGCPAGNF